MLIPGTLTIFNFIKIKEIKNLSLRGKGLVLLKGINLDEPQKAGNGVGKSLFGDAYHWLMSGNTTRNIPVSMIVGPWAKYAMVSHTFNIGKDTVTVTRYRNHPKEGNSLQLVSGMDVSNRAIKINEERLQQLIGCSFNLFRLSCFHNSDDKFHFSRMDASMRAKILDEIIGTSDADVVGSLKILRKELFEIEAYIQDADNQIKILSDRQNSYTEQKKNYIASLNLLNNNKETKRMELKSAYDFIIIPDVVILDNKIKEINLSLKEAENTKLKNQVYEKQNQSIRVITERYKTELRNAVSELNKYDHTHAVVGIRCTACGIRITDKNVLEYEDFSKQQKIAAQNKIDEINIKLDECNELFLKNNNSIIPIIDTTELNQQLANLEKQKISIKGEQDKKDSLGKQIADLDKSSLDMENNLKNQIKECDNKIGACIREAFEHTVYFERELINKKQVEQLIEFYGPSGYRPLVMSYYAPVLSDTANYFLRDFTGGYEEIQISTKAQLASGEVRDKVMIDVISNKVSKPFPDAWSSGEGQAIDLSLNFGIMRLAQVKAAKEFGFMYLDEATNWLSPQLVGKLLKLLRDKFLKPEMTIIVTTHASVDERQFDNVWTMVKENGECKLIGDHNG